MSFINNTLLLAKYLIDPLLKGDSSNRNIVIHRVFNPEYMTKVLK